MSSQQPSTSLDISNTKVFEYQQEVIVELHGQTPDGEFDTISYAFTDAPDEEMALRPPEIDSAHEDLVHEAVAETDYTLV